MTPRDTTPRDGHEELPEGLHAALPEEHIPAAADTLDALLPDEGEPAAEPEPGVPALADLGLEVPEDPDEARDFLVAALLASRQEAGEYLEALQRVAAEFENYRRRIERDRDAIVGRASQRIVEQLLPALDNFDAAMSYEPQTPAEEKVLDGLRGTHQQLMEVLSKEGLEAVAAEGASFDPSLHEAVAGQVDTDDLVVTSELRRGYVLNDRLLRPALVTVGPADTG